MVLTLLAIGFLINSFSYVPCQVLQSTHHAETAAKGTAAYAVLNVALFVLLIPRFGIFGAASGFLIAQILFVPFFIGRANRLLGARWTAVIGASYMRPLLATSVAAGACWVSRLWVNSFATLAGAMVVGFLIYALSVAFFVLDDRERAACRFLVNRWKRSLQNRGSLTEDGSAM